MHKLKRAWIKGHKGRYWITEHGHVYSVKMKKFFKHPTNNLGYVVLDLKGESKLLHRLVAETFLPNPNKLPQVNHKDEDKTNNTVENLEWCTAQHNSAHSKAKTYILCSPLGERVEVYNMTQFCLNLKLPHSSMAAMALGYRTHANGWTLWEK